MKHCALVLLLALTGCSAAPAQQATRAYPSLVSLNPCTDAIMAEVADPAQIRAVSHYSQDPASSSMDLATAQRFHAVSGSVEEVLNLDPDIVIDGTYTGPATSAALQRLGYRLEQFPIAGTIADSEAQVRRVAALAGHPDRGAALVRRIEAALGAARPPQGPPVSALIWQSGGMVPGRGTLIADLLNRTGFRNAAALRGLKQADLLPLEQVLAIPPQLILVAGNEQAQEDRMLRHPALRAMQGTSRASLDPALLWCGGPTIIRAAGMLKEVRRMVGRKSPRSLRQAQAERLLP